MIDFLFTNALAGLALAAIAGILIWTFRPAPAVRHALWLIVLLKLVSPTGLVVEVPLPVDTPTDPAIAKVHPVIAEEYVVEEEIFTVVVETRPGQSIEEAAALAMRNVDADEPTDDSAESTLASIESPSGPPFDYRPFLLGLWVLGALVIGWRQGRETLRFARFTRRSLLAPDTLVAEVSAVAKRLGVNVPRVRVLPGLTSPVMWCLWRPVLLWPAGLECRLKGDGRRAVIAHELAHLRRRDHWVRRLEMVAAVLHWWNPLFWIARKKLRADAELACDAWAAGQADRRAYAEALLEVCSFNPRRRPAPAVGVIGEGRRAMQERLTMIMRDRVPCRLAFGAKLVVALMALAAVPAWTLGQSAPTKPQPAPSDPQVRELENQIRALAEKLEALKAVRKSQAEAEKAAAESHKKAADVLKEVIIERGVTGEKNLGLAKKVEAQVKVLVAGQDGIKVIGADGRELKDVKVIITDTKDTKGVKEWKAEVKPMIEAQGTPLRVRAIEAKPNTEAPRAVRVTKAIAGDDVKVQGFELHTKPKVEAYQLHTDTKSGSFAFTHAGDKLTVTGTATGSGTHTITLSRATYKLSKDQAAALSSLLGSIKATVMETKVDGENLTVTTTPEAQAAIGQIVRLVQGQGSGGGNTFKFTTSPEGTKYLAVPVAPVIPATPATPNLPSKPAKPSSTKKPDSVEGIQELIELKLEGLKPALEKGNIDLKLKLEPALKELEKLKDIENIKDLEKLKNLSEEIKARLKDLKPAGEKKPEKPEK
jgi:beta-lactamase regulating signal transducer with metallopeptidase domain